MGYPRSLGIRLGHVEVLGRDVPGDPERRLARPQTRLFWASLGCRVQNPYEARVVGAPPENKSGEDLRHRHVGYAKDSAREV